jgi:RNA polymerase sigma-70 factor (ECF subfamily)
MTDEATNAEEAHRLHDTVEQGTGSIQEVAGQVGGLHGVAAIAGFEEMALPHLDHLARFATWLTGNDADAADLVQDTYLKALRAWQNLRPDSDVRAWLFTICRNAHRSNHRRHRRSESVGASELEALSAASVFESAVHAGVDAQFGRFDLTDALRRELRQLPGSYREVVALVDLEGLSYEEAAGVVGVPVGTVRSRLHRGRRLLKERLLVYAQDAGWNDSIAQRT